MKVFIALCTVHFFSYAISYRLVGIKTFESLTMFSLVFILCSLQFIALTLTAPVSDFEPDFESDFEFDDIERRGTNCPANFRNVVFNTDASKLAGWPNAIWDSLEANGVSSWSMILHCGSSLIKIAFQTNKLSTIQLASPEIPSIIPQPMNLQVGDPQRRRAQLTKLKPKYVWIRDM